MQPSDATVEQPQRRRRAYFFWDYDLSEEDVRRILTGGDPYERAWVISRLLEAARWDDIWTYITVDDIRRHWDDLTFRAPYFREAWEHALVVWARTPGGGDASACAGLGMTEASRVRELRPEYQAAPQPQLRPGILTPMQETFLRRFFAFGVGQRFFLTGGTALAAFYLGHRLSDDLDLFTLDDEAFGKLETELGRLGREMHWEVATTLTSPALRRVVFTSQGGEELRVDLVRDIDVQFGEHEQTEGVILDSLLNIAVNKVTTVFGRAAIKDFVDLYVLLKRGYHLEALFDLAKQKDAGFTPFYFGTMLRQIHRVKTMPVMLTPVTLAELIAFYDPLADDLIARQRPGSDGACWRN
jgi:predicted nucleotidyltransferase